MLGQLTENQIRRYSRQILLPEVGGRGQRKLLAARVRLLGTGTVAATAGVYLAAAGVGAIGLDAGEESVRMAARMTGMNPEVRVPVGGGAGDIDLAVDGTGDPATAGGSPRVWAVPSGTVGRVSRFVPGRSACRRCLPPELRGACAPMSPPAEAVLGSLLAVEALEVLLGIGAGLADRVLEYDAEKTTFRTHAVKRDPACPACGDGA